MMKVQGTKVRSGKVWLIIGKATGLAHATVKYLESRKQIVFCYPDINNALHELVGTTNYTERIDMLVINDVKNDVQVERLFESIGDISSFMCMDGTGKIIFAQFDESCFTHLKSSTLFQELKKIMRDKMIGVECFEFF